MSLDRRDGDIRIAYPALPADLPATGQMDLRILNPEGEAVASLGLSWAVRRAVFVTCLALTTLSFASTALAVNMCSSGGSGLGPRPDLNDLCQPLPNRPDLFSIDPNNPLLYTPPTKELAHNLASTFAVASAVLSIAADPFSPLLKYWIPVTTAGIAGTLPRSFDYALPAADTGLFIAQSFRLLGVAALGPEEAAVVALSLALSAASLKLSQVDPPNPDYRVVLTPKLTLSTPNDFSNTGGLAGPLSKVVNALAALAQETALGIDSVEKFQGASAARDSQWTTHQLALAKAHAANQNMYAHDLALALAELQTALHDGHFTNLVYDPAAITKFKASLALQGVADSVRTFLDQHEFPTDQAIATFLASFNENQFSGNLDNAFQDLSDALNGITPGFLHDGEPVAATPEPTTLLLLGSTLAGVGLTRWRRRRQN